MNIFDSDILKMKFSQPDPQGGDLLIAEPLMLDAPFQRSVVTIIEHTPKNGSMGLIANHLSPYTLAEIVDEIECEETIPIFVGGPVHKERLYYLHRLGDLLPESIEIREGLYVSGSFNVVKEYINSGEPVSGLIRFFLGYSGWEKDQLRQELDNFDWAVSTAMNPDDILHLEGEEAWQRAVQNLDPNKYRLWLNCPRSVIMN